MPRRDRTLTYVLAANAAALGLIGLALLSRGPSLLPTAIAQQAPQPIAGGAGLFLMPAQLSSSSWGCYVMDVDRQTLMVYQYTPGDRALKLNASRDFSNDRRLRRFNTTPSPDEVKSLLDLEAGAAKPSPTP